MKRFVIAIILMLSLVLCACSGGSPSGPVGAPFYGDACWEWDGSRVEEEFGECPDPYPSIYGGTTLSYPHSWHGREGTIKFMFSEDGRLACVAWTLITGSSAELDEAYAEVGRIEMEKNGPDSKLAKGSGNSGKVWYLKDRDVLVSTVGVGGSYGLQYSYISRDFSKRDIAKSR